MLNIRDLRIDTSRLGKMLLVDVKPGYQYKDGVKQEGISHYVYSVALPKHSLEKINVKINGKKILEKPEGNFPEVVFTGIELSVYIRDGQGFISGEAVNIEVAGKKA